MDAELKKALDLIRSKGATVNGSVTSSTFLNTTDSLEAIKDTLAVPAADSANNTNEADVVGNKTDTNAGNSIFSRHLVPTADVATNVSSRDVVGNKSDAAVTTVGTVASGLGYIKGVLNQIATVIINVAPTGMGRTAVFEKVISSAANAGDITVATVGSQPCMVESVVIYATTAQTADMTSCGVFGGVSKVVTFIDAATAVQASLNAADKQVSFHGARRLAVGKTIVISLEGTGATAVDLVVSTVYRSSVSGGVLS